MKDVIFRFVYAEAITTHPMIYWGIAGAWIAMLIGAFLSIRQQMIGASGKWVWLMLIVLVPVGGLFLYLIWCLLRVDYSFLKFIVGPPGRLRRSVRTKNHAM